MELVSMLPDTGVVSFAGAGGATPVPFSAIFCVALVAPRELSVSFRLLERVPAEAGLKAMVSGQDPPAARVCIVEQSVLAPEAPSGKLAGKLIASRVSRTLPMFLNVTTSDWLERSPTPVALKLSVGGIPRGRFMICPLSELVK